MPPELPASYTVSRNPQLPTPYRWEAAAVMRDHDGSTSVVGYGTTPTNALAACIAQVNTALDLPAHYHLGFKSLRMRQRTSLREAAALVRTTAAHVSRVERGQQEISPDEILAWADLLGISRADLLEETRRLVLAGRALHPRQDHR